MKKKKFKNVIIWNLLFEYHNFGYALTECRLGVTDLNYTNVFIEHRDGGKYRRFTIKNWTARG